MLLPLYYQLRLQPIESMRKTSIGIDGQTLYLFSLLLQTDVSLIARQNARYIQNILSSNP